MEAENSSPSAMSDDAPDETEGGLTWDLGEETTMEVFIRQEIVKDTLPLLSEGCNLLQQAFEETGR
jgi:hypothetical protein